VYVHREGALAHFVLFFGLAQHWSGAPLGPLTSWAPRIAGSAGAVVTPLSYGKPKARYFTRI